MHYVNLLTYVLTIQGLVSYCVKIIVLKKFPALRSTFVQPTSFHTVFETLGYDFASRTLLSWLSEMVRAVIPRALLSVQYAS